jgi:hypothetical protein
MMIAAMQEMTREIMSAPSKAATAYETWRGEGGFRYAAHVGERIEPDAQPVAHLDSSAAAMRRGQIGRRDGAVERHR